MLEYIDADKLVLSSDCGFGRQGVPRPIAMYKAAALAQGANIVRGELGAEQTHVRAADPELQVDVMDRAPGAGRRLSAAASSRSCPASSPSSSAQRTTLGDEEGAQGVVAARLEAAGFEVVRVEPDAAAALADPAAGYPPLALRRGGAPSSASGAAAAAGARCT